MTPDELLAARESLGLTQAQWARALHVHQPYVSKIECGRQVPSATLVRLIEMYRRHGVPAEWLAKQPARISPSGL